MAKLVVHIATGPENPTRSAGTGSVSEHLGAIRAAGLTVFLSGMSSKARGIEGGEGFELAQPQKLVELATSCDTSAPSVRIVRLRPRAPALDIAARLQVVP